MAIAANINFSNRITFDGRRSKFRLASAWRHNIVKLGTTDYLLRYLDIVSSSKGGNSSVFLLVDPEHQNDESKHLVIKICNRADENASFKYRRRFQRELLALERASKENKRYIVSHYHHGHVKWNNLSFPYYTMEKGDCDLTNYLKENVLNVDQKLILCFNLLKAFKDLHSLEMYHRDIKHDNILMFGNECKVGDLGLVRFREDDLEFVKDELGERIGAFGWESPETINKYFTEQSGSVGFDCEIDYQSDIFQLGKLFWFIFQGNLPVGQVIQSDFLVKDKNIFQVIFWMLQHGKSNRRPDSISEIEEHLNLSAVNYAVS
ncbi:MAG: protein kinase [Cyclobacteriaceae bacterium]